jgi:hypothetical protein
MRYHFLKILFAVIILAGCKKLSENSEDWKSNSNDLEYSLTPKIEIISIADQFNETQNFHFGTVTFKVDLSGLKDGLGRRCIIRYRPYYVFEWFPVETDFIVEKVVTSPGLQTCTLNYTNLIPNQDMTMDVSLVLNDMVRWTSTVNVGHFD